MNDRIEHALSLVRANAREIAAHQAARGDYRNPRERFEREQVAQGDIREARARLSRSVDYAISCGATEEQIAAALA